MFLRWEKAGVNLTVYGNYADEGARWGWKF